MRRKKEAVEADVLTLQFGKLRPKRELYFPIESIRFEWLSRACLASDHSKCLALAVALTMKAQLSKSSTVRLPDWLLVKCGLGQRALRKALARLEAAGLVKVERAPGRKPDITLLDYRRRPGEKIKLEVVK